MEENGLTFYLEKVVHAPQEMMEDFEGPLDLILFLLSKHKIEIQDLQISLLCRQFLDWIEKREALDMEVASEFIAMASHLVYLKSKNLLAVGEKQDEELDELKLQLEEHLLEEERQKMDALRTFLAPRAEFYRTIFTKPPQPLPKATGYNYVHSPDDLVKALREICVRSERRRPLPPEDFSGIVGKEPYPVSGKMESILRRLVDRGRMLLSKLLSGAQSRSELVATFLAVLEMCRNREIHLTDQEDDAWISLPNGDTQ